MNAPPVPGAGSCSGMFTANTMSNLSEALGMSLPYNGTAPAVFAERIWLAKETGYKVVDLVEKDPEAAGHYDQRCISQYHCCRYGARRIH